MIFDLFGVNIHHYPTLPSLAFAISRRGAVDMYIPKPPKGVEIKGYDVNSLYPKQMFDKLMPIGFPTYFEGDIRKIDLNAFGFFYCKIIAPDNIKHPILQTHVKTSGGIRTIAPIGT
jgi:hypothetical protein